MYVWTLIETFCREAPLLAVINKECATSELNDDICNGGVITPFSVINCKTILCSSELVVDKTASNVSVRNWRHGLRCSSGIVRVSYMYMSYTKAT